MLWHPPQSYIVHYNNKCSRGCNIKQNTSVLLKNISTIIYYWSRVEQEIKVYCVEYNSGKLFPLKSTTKEYSKAWILYFCISAAIHQACRQTIALFLQYLACNMYPDAQTNQMYRPSTPLRHYHSYQTKCHRVKQQKYCKTEQHTQHYPKRDCN